MAEEFGPGPAHYNTEKISTQLFGDTMSIDMFGNPQ